MRFLFLIALAMSTVPSFNSCFAQFIVAHRGASHDAPENTLAAFRLAWERGADAIEGDFYLSADGEIVCIHDKTTKRLAPNQPELTVAKSTLQQLRQLDVGSWKDPKYAGEKIPTFAEVVALVPEGKRILVEVKCGPEIVPELKKQLKASGLKADQVVIIAFNDEVVSACREAMPQYKCNWLTSYKQNKETKQWSPTQEEVISTLQRTEATGLGTQANLEIVDRPFVEAVKASGCEFHVWTVNDLALANQLVKSGVDSITTDRPAYIRQAIPKGEKAAAVDSIQELQKKAIEAGQSPAAHWGWEPDTYTLWGTHSNRLIPVYTFGTKDAGDGIDLDDYQGENSIYRSEAKIQKVYGRPTYNTVNPKANYLDQTNIYDLQKAALDAGKKHIFLVVFDGMDWQTTRAAAIYNEQKISYESGRGTGTHFQEYAANGTSQFGFMVTSPHNEGTDIDVNSQRVLNPGGTIPGGYDASRGGANPWTDGDDILYPVTKSENKDVRHAYTDSASSAVSMTGGIKTYNNAINVDANGTLTPTIAHLAQLEGYAVGAVSSVPISHATPAAAYAHNVHRNDYQDLTRDLLGLNSISHPDNPLSGLDVLIGGGYGTDRDKDNSQGDNFVPGNSYLAEDDLKAVDVENGGKYVVAIRTKGVSGSERLKEAARQARENSQRLFGFYGVGSTKGHLPYQTADGNFDPTVGRQKKAEQYSEGDLNENPTLVEMTEAALTVLETNPKGFWLMVEAGDVDWANHDNNLDNSIGAVNSGDAAVKVVTDWVEENSNWDESVMIVTADHGHYLFIDRPELLISQKQPTKAASTFEAVKCEKRYPHHLQGFDMAGEEIFWSFTTTLVKTNTEGKVLTEVPVANHHGDLCYHDGKLYVAVNLGDFNNPAGKADSWVYVYDAETLEELARHETQEVVYGAGGIGFQGGHFFVVGGLPKEINENYIYEYDADFQFLKKHTLSSGQTLMGIQTAAFVNDQWWFGCYGSPPTLLVTDNNFQMQGRYEFNCSLGIAGDAEGRLLSATGHCSKEEGCSGAIRLVLPDEKTGLRIARD